MKSRFTLLPLTGLTGLLGLLGLLGGPTAAWAANVDFAKEIRPLLADRCFSCHGEKKQESGLRLDRKADALKGGDHGAAIVPGKAPESVLLQAVAGTHAEVAKMPKKGEALTPEQIALLHTWIEQGAPWPETQTQPVDLKNPAQHWAFQPVRRPEPPKLNSKNRKLARSPIDQFVFHKLEQEKLAPSPEADRVALIRRVSLDLTGLPPSPEEVDAFVADKASDAYAKVVERLLASPHYGEKWARHWLDAARYADSNGFEKDRTRSIWPWRDWVIRAFNTDLPFDQFTVEQLAGDLLAQSEVGSRKAELEIATGFLRNSMVNMEGGIEPEKFRVETIIDRVDAVGRTWLGLTIACAQCHNHKYDPVSQKEYFQFYDFLNQDVEPKLDVLSPSTRAKRGAIMATARALEAQLLADPAVSGKFTAWLGAVAKIPVAWQPIAAKEWHSTPMKFEQQEDLSLLGGGDVHNSSIIRVWVDLPQTNITGFRLEALNHGNLPNQGPGLDGNGDFLVNEFTVELTPLQELAAPNAGATGFVATTNRVKFIRALADVEPTGLPANLMIDGMITNGGWGAAFTQGRKNQERRAVFQAEQPVGFEGGSRLLITVNSKPGGGLNNSSDKVSSFVLGRLRLSFTTHSGALAVDPLSERQRALLVAAQQGNAAARQELFRVFLFQEPSLANAAKQWDEAWQDWPRAENTTLALQLREPRRDTKIFKRGDWQKPTTSVTAAVPASLSPLPEAAPRNRLGLARWLVSRDNPLTARVLVNRVWMHYFGAGLVTTPEDFGVRSDPPSHPELLDWLAGEFMAPTSRPQPLASKASAWSFKHLHRLIVNSATYRQSSRVTPELLEQDPYNRLLARGPRVRVESEVVQDIAFKAAGLLSPKIGGPSVFPPLPDGVMSLAYGPIPWNVSEGDDRYRRAMYTFWKRSVPHPAMLTFDAPTAEQSCVRRMRSNTPLQALVTLNDPNFNQAARWLAWRALGAANGDVERARWAFRQCVSRPPSPQEVSVLLKLLGEARAEFASRAQDAPQFAFADPKNPPPLPPGATATDVAAWSTVTRAILNLDETITKE
jgi:mono/diheme cytochrome c family protein